MAIKIYRYTTEEGLEIKVELTFSGIEDERLCLDWQVSVKPSLGFLVNDHKQHVSWQQPGFTIKTSKSAAQ